MTLSLFSEVPFPDMMGLQTCVLVKNKLIFEVPSWNWVLTLQFFEGYLEYIP